MDIHQLRSFRMIVEKGSFQDAANQLNYSLSAISYQMQQLENEVKFPLFEKIGRRMLPTELSLKLIPHIKSIEEQMEQIKLLNVASNKVEGSLNITISDSLLTYIIQPVLKEFFERAPEVQMKLKVKNCYEIQKDIIKNNIDLGIHYQVGGYDSQIKVLPLAQFDIGLIASRDFPEDQKDFESSGQTKQCYVISNDPNAIYQGYFEDYLKSKNIRMERNIELWSIEAIKKSIINNLGIACLPHFVVQEELQKKEIIAIPIKGFTPKVTAIAAYHSHKWVSPAMKLFLEILEKKMKLEEQPEVI